MVLGSLFLCNFVVVAGTSFLFLFFAPIVPWIAASKYRRLLFNRVASSNLFVDNSFSFLWFVISWQRTPASSRLVAGRAWPSTYFALGTQDVSSIFNPVSNLYRNRTRSWRWKNDGDALSRTLALLLSPLDLKLTLALDRSTILALVLLQNSLL